MVTLRCWEGVERESVIRVPLRRKKDDRVDWMYAGVAGHVDREEYLLGKRIDRQIDPLLASEEREKEVRSDPSWGISFKSMNLVNIIFSELLYSIWKLMYILYSVDV